MGREEIRRLCLNVWASPAVSPGGRAGCRGPDRRIIPGSVSGSVSGCRSDHIRSILQSPPNTGGRLRAGVDRSKCFVRILTKHFTRVRSGRPPIRSHSINPIRFSPAGGGPGFSGTAGTCRATVRNPGALRGRLGAGVVAYVPRYGAYVTLSRAPRETALFPVHCSHSSLPGRYASAAYTPVCGGTTGNMPRIPAGRVLRYASVCVGMVHL